MGVFHHARMEAESRRHLVDAELRRSLGGSSDHSDLDEQAGNEVPRGPSLVPGFTPVNFCS